MLRHLNSCWGCQESHTCDDLGLSKDNLLCDAALPLVQLLTNAGDDAETVLQSVGCLLANELKPYMSTIIISHF